MSRPPRVVHLTTTDMSLDWLLGPQLRAFCAAGYEVVGMSAPGPHVPALREAGIVHVPVPALTRAPSVASDGQALGQLVRVLRQVRPDILHTHNPKPGVLGRVAGRLARLPFVVNTQHGLYAQPEDGWRRRVPVYALERVAAACSDLELVQSPEDVDTLVERLHVPARKVRLLGNGIDLDRFSRASLLDGSGDRLRAEWGIADDAVLVGVVGRLVREKGLAELLDVAVGTSAARPDLRWVVVGPDDPDKPDALDPELVERARAAGVRFTGARTDMPACYAAMDVFVTASWREGFPRAAMEAAAMGLPIVATDVRGCRQVVDDGRTGLLVPVRDPARLRAAVLALTDDADRRRAMGEAGRRKAEWEFDQQRVIRITLDAYAELLGDRAPPRAG